jgi:hypothetical protein
MGIPKQYMLEHAQLVTEFIGCSSDLSNLIRTSKLFHRLGMKQFLKRELIAICGEGSPDDMQRTKFVDVYDPLCNRWYQLPPLPYFMNDSFNVRPFFTCGKLFVISDSGLHVEYSSERNEWIFTSKYIILIFYFSQ